MHCEVNKGVSYKRILDLSFNGIYICTKITSFFKYIEQEVLLIWEKSFKCVLKLSYTCIKLSNKNEKDWKIKLKLNK